MTSKFNKPDLPYQGFPMKEGFEISGDDNYATKIEVRAN